MRKSSKYSKDKKLLFIHEELKRQLDIVDTICKKYQIGYYLYYGTLLGAVREGDVIPWDDDVDLLFTREQLQKFEQAFYKENIEDYTFGYDGLWIKRLKPKANIVKYGINTSSISSDFLVLSNISNKQYKNIIRKLILKTLQGMIKPRINFKGNIYLDLAQLSTWFAGRALPYKYKIKAYEFFSDCFDKSDAGCFVSNGEFKHMNLVFTAKAFHQSINKRFGNLNLPVMIGYDEVLTKIYGDYTVRPPEHERNQPHISYADD